MKRPSLSLLAVVAGLAMTAPPGLRAADPTPVKPDSTEVIYPRLAPAPNGASGGSSTGYATGLVAAFLLAGAGGWLFWRNRHAPGSTAVARKLVIAETKSLGNRQFLVVASYEDKRFLLGVCPGRIELLTPLDAAPPVRSP